MGIFITQGNYTQQAMKGLVDHPEDRTSAVSALMESVGGKLLHYYITTGDYDFLIISEGASLTDTVAGLMIAGSSGGVCNLKTTMALTAQEATGSMEKANAVRSQFRAAGAGN